MNLTIEDWFNLRKNTPGDINEHMDTLKRYAEECDHITELGTGGVYSTWGFLITKPKTFITVDIIEPHIRPGVKEALDEAEMLAKQDGIDFHFFLADTTSDDFEIDETDLLFIDTYHVYEHLKKELEKHANKSKKYIILHDTTTFADRGEVQSYLSKVSPINRESPTGLWPAIEEFLAENLDWIIHERFTHNNGLTILKKVKHFAF